jgi:oligogalacturonide transport system permease protein
MKTKQLGKKYIGLLYISPWLLGFLIFQLYPFIASFFYSFTSYNLMKSASFVGLSNYAKIFSDPMFIQSLKVTFAYVFMVVPGKLIFALLIALILNMKIRGIGIFRTVYYLPSIFGGSVAVALLWKALFMHEGTVNRILSVFQLPPVDWLGDSHIALITITLLNIWQFGSSMVLFLAGLKQIPNELYEAANVDGSTKWHSFLHITMPMLSPIVLFNLVMQVISAFQDFTGSFIVTKGGPNNSTYLYGMLLYDDAFKYFRMGYSSALSWVLFAIIMLFTLLIFKSSRQWVFYEDGGDL